jgi:hypothetical protein
VEYIKVDIHNIAEDKMMLEREKNLLKTELCKKDDRMRKNVEDNINVLQKRYDDSCKKLDNTIKALTKNNKEDKQSKLESKINEYTNSKFDKNDDSDRLKKLREQYRQDFMKESDKASDIIDKEYEKLSKKYDLKDKSLNKELMQLKIDVAAHSVYLDLYKTMMKHENIKYDDTAKNILDTNFKETTEKLKIAQRDLDKRYKELSDFNNKTFNSKKYVTDTKNNITSKKNENKLTQARLNEDTWSAQDNVDWYDFNEKLEESREELQEKYYQELIDKIPKNKSIWAKSFARIAADRDIIEKVLGNPLLNTNPKMREKYLKKQETVEEKFKDYAKQAREYRAMKSTGDTDLKQKVTSDVEKTMKQMVPKIRQQVKNELHEISDKNKNSYNILSEFKKNINGINKKVADEFNEYIYDKYEVNVDVTSLVNTISLYSMGALTLHHKNTVNDAKREAAHLSDTFEAREELAIDLVKKQLISEIIKKRS